MSHEEVSEDKRIHPADLVLSFYDQVDKQIERQLELAVEAGKPVSCTSCTEAYCCYQPTAVTLIEAMPIAMRLGREGKNTSRFRRELKELGEAMEGADKVAWFDSRTPCPFLKDRRCTVYRERPMMSCRTYFVVTPIKLCNPNQDEHPTVGNVDLRPAQAAVFKLSLDVARDMQILEEEEDKLLLGSLPRMVWIWLSCMGRKDWKGFIRAQPWISRDNGRDWFNGKNPFRKQGRQWIRTKRSKQSGQSSVK